MTSYDSTWGAAYLQIVVVMLVFTLGLPALLIQLAIPEGLRWIHIRKLLGVFLLALGSAVLVGIAGVFVLRWPCAPGQSIKVAFPLTPRVVAALALLVTALVWVVVVVTVNRGVVVARLGSDTLRQLTRPLRVLPPLPSQAPCFVVACWWWTMRTVRRLWSRLSHPETALEQLVHVVSYSKPGGEKDKVIGQLHRVAVRAVSHKNYDGARLGELLSQLPSIVTSHTGEGMPVASDYGGLIALVTDILARLRATHPHSPDYLSALNALHALCGDAIGRGHEAAALKAVSELTMYLPDTAIRLAELGSELCTRGHYSHVRNLLNHLACYLGNDSRPQVALVWLLAALAAEKSSCSSEVACDAFRTKYADVGQQVEALNAAEVYVLNRLCRCDVVDLIRRFRSEHLGLVRN